MNLSYRKEIDGLRAIAVLPVLLFHAGFQQFSGGFVGVDIFFVISGYLITSILLSDLYSGNFSIVSFYERRARRILPALFFMIFAITPFAVYYLFPDDLQRFGASILATTLFFSNIYFSSTTGYFDIDAEYNPLIHTWSLAVEEQYYLFFPIFLFALHKYNKEFLGIIFLILLSFALAQFGSVFSLSWPFIDLTGIYNLSQTFFGTFYMPFGRIWELLAGSLVALITQQKKIIAASNFGFLANLGFLLILISIFFYDRATVFPSHYTLLPVIGTALVILFINKNLLLYKFLTLKFLTFIGLISYSLYLWHQPLLSFYRLASDKTSIIGIILTLLFSGIIAFISWKFIEAPFRNKRTFDKRSIFTISAYAIFLSVAIGSLMYGTRGFENYYSNNLSNEKLSLYEQIQSFKQKDYWFSSLQNDGKCKHLSEGVSKEIKQTLLNCLSNNKKGIFVIGDSHAVDIYNALALNISNEDTIIGITQSGCRIFNHDVCSYDEIKAFILDNADKIKIVIFNQAGNYLFEEEKSLGQMNMFKSSLVRDFTVNDEFINQSITYLADISRKVKTVYLGPFIEPYIEHTYAMKKGSFEAFNKPSETIIKNFSKLDNRHKEIFSSLKFDEDEHITYLSSIEVFDQRDNFEFIDPYERKFLYSDSDHLSTYGESKLGKKLVKALSD